MDAEPDGASASPFVFDLTKSRCPMCGATIESDAAQCEQCGEAQEVEAESLAVPIFSPTAIGTCTFLWSPIIGMTMVWLNCRRLNRNLEAQKTFFFGLMMTVGYVFAMLIAPEDAPVTMFLNVVAVILVVCHASFVLREPFRLQKLQCGPYRSIWVGHGIGIMLLIGAFSLVMAYYMVLEFAGFPSH